MVSRANASERSERWGVCPRLSAWPLGRFEQPCLIKDGRSGAASSHNNAVATNGQSSIAHRSHDSRSRQRRVCAGLVARSRCLLEPADQSASWANATTGSDAGSTGLFFQRRRPVSFTTSGTSIALARFSTVESAHPSRTAIACLQRPSAVSSRIRSSSSAVQSRRRPIRITPLAGSINGI